MGDSKNYVAMNTTHLLDPDLSLSAKGLLSLILAIPEQEINTFELMELSKTKEKDIEKLLIELEQAGYFNQKQ